MGFDVGSEFISVLTSPVGAHIAAGNTPYQKIVEKLANKYPNLRYDETTRRRARLNLSHPLNVTIFHFSSSGPPCHEEPQSLDALKRLLSGTGQSAQSTVRELLVLEGTDPEYTAAVGEAWQVDPVFFLRHQRNGLWDAGHIGGNTHPLPSQMEHSVAIKMPYAELRWFEGGFEEYHLRAAENNRHIATTSIGSKLDETGVIHREGSFWARRLPRDGWQALMIVDEPVRQVISGRSTGASLKTMLNEPYQGGFPDFSAYSTLADMLQAPDPPRSSTYDDICHYYQHHQQQLNLTSDPRCVSAFLKLVVASHYNKVFTYTRGLFDQLEYILENQREVVLLDPINLMAPFWADLHHFRRRVEYYIRHLSDIVLQLGIDELQISPTVIAEPADKNFLFLLRHFQQLDARANSIFTSFSTLSGIAGTRQSLLESKAAQRLSVLAIVFLPLSFTSGLFSMSAQYLPGANHFWIYCVVSISIIFGIFFIPLSHETIRWVIKIPARLKEMPRWFSRTSGTATNIAYQDYYVRDGFVLRRKSRPEVTEMELS